MPIDEAIRRQQHRRPRRARLGDHRRRAARAASPTARGPRPKRIAGAQISACRAPSTSAPIGERHRTTPAPCRRRPRPPRAGQHPTASRPEHPPPESEALPAAHYRRPMRQVDEHLIFPVPPNEAIVASSSRWKTPLPEPSSALRSALRAGRAALTRSAGSAGSPVTVVLEPEPRPAPSSGYSPSPCRRWRSASTVATAC